MPGLLKAFTNLIRGKSRELAKNIADPVRDSKLAIEDSEKLIADFTARIAKLVAQNRLLQRQQKEAEGEVVKFQGIAEKAIGADNVEDARRSLELKLSAQKQAVNLSAEITRNEQLIVTLRDQLAKARAKVSAAKRSIVSLEARHDGAKIRKELAKASSEFNTDGSPLAALDDLEKAVDSQEAEAEAWEELTQDDKSSTSLEEKYGGMGATDVDDELRKLMEMKK